MELKDYQERVLDRLADYLHALGEWEQKTAVFRAAAGADTELLAAVPDLTAKAWEALRQKGLLPPSRASIPFSPRKDGAGNVVPNVTLKVPTGGGKTLLAAAGVELILNKWLRRNTGMVLWVVPNEAIYAQTKKALTNRAHPYRQILDRASANRLRFLEKESPLAREDVDSHLCVLLAMLQAANVETKESRRLFRDRGNVRGFFPSELDFVAHDALRQAIPNLEAYGEAGSIGTNVKDSLANALRIVRPIVVLDEGHKAFSALARKTVYGFNPAFVMELSATPPDDKKEGVYSNWLVDIRGKDLEAEEMIKLPITVKVRGGNDWKATLRSAVEQVSVLETAAAGLREEEERYVRPICLVQVERTGKEQRDTAHIHAEDARECLLDLGFRQEKIALKTAETDELSDPDSPALLSPASSVRFIITKYALQEGWDCPFAYVLCALAPVTSERALTQLVGRILRQPDARKTGIDELDQCYVICLHTDTQSVVSSIKAGLEQEGMDDLVQRVDVAEPGGEGAGPGVDTGRVLPLQRREEFSQLEILLPRINWVESDEVRPLDYEQDILYRVDWNNVPIDGLAELLVAGGSPESEQVTRWGYAGRNELHLVDKAAPRPLLQDFDAVFATRAVTDLIRNPWVARELVGRLTDSLQQRGWSRKQMGAHGSRIVDGLREHVKDVLDERAEALFREDVAVGRIQFRLLGARHNYAIPRTIPNDFPVNSSELRRDCDGDFVKKSLFVPAFKDAFNPLEQRVAGWLDCEVTLR